MSVTNRTMAIANLVGYIIMMTLNGLANGLPLNGKTTGELSDQYPNLFVPAGVTFSIWGVIYLGLLVYVIRGFQTIKKGGAVFRSHYWFLVSCIFNAMWIYYWHYERIFSSLIVMICLLISLIAIYQSFKREDLSGVDFWTVKVPISIYLGWITIATIANVTALLVSVEWSGAGISDVVWTAIMIVVGSGMAAIFLLKERNFAYAMVVIWAFAGILIKRKADGSMNDLLIEQTVLGALIVITLLAAYTLFRNRRTTSA